MNHPLPATTGVTPEAGEANPSPWADPGAAGERLALEEFPTFILGRLAHAIQRDITSGYLDEFGLSAPQWRILAALAAYTPIAFSELVKLSMSDKALVSRAVQSLAGAGLAQADADPEHGKKLVCRITPKGRRLYQRVLPRAQQAQASILALLEREERVALHAALVKLREALGATPPARG
jgi:DNA-binding MarR family transcriptional regulator